MLVGFIRGHVDSLGRDRMHSRSHWFTMSREGDVTFILVYVVSLGQAQLYRVHSDSRGFTPARLGVVGFVLLRVVSFGQT